MAVMSSGFAAFLQPGLNKIITPILDYPKIYEKLYNVKGSSRQFEVAVGLTGLGLVPQKAEGTPILYDEPKQGYNKTYFHLTYAMGFRITMEAYQDDLYAELGEKMAGKLGRSYNYTQEVLAAGTFNNGFGDGATSPDGVSLFNSNHPLVGYGYYGNRPTTPVALSQTALQSALTTMALTVDDRGIIQNYRARWLMVAPALEFYAKELVHSSLKPDGNQNNVNSVQDSVDVIVNPYLTNPTAWFLLTDKELIELMWYNRMQPKRETHDDFNTGDAAYKITGRFSNGYAGWRGMYGSPGS